jgi:hypothetical protein
MASMLRIDQGFQDVMCLFYQKIAFPHPGGFQDKERTLKAYDAWNERMQAIIPPDRLLVFNVKDGYKPLCQFLGVPEPAQKFPHENDTAFLISGRRNSARWLNGLLIILSLILAFVLFAIFASVPLSALVLVPSVLFALMPIDW